MDWDMTVQTSKQPWDAHARKDLRREEREHMHERRRNTVWGGNTETEIRPSYGSEFTTQALR